MRAHTHVCVRMRVVVQSPDPYEIVHTHHHMQFYYEYIQHPRAVTTFRGTSHQNNVIHVS